MRHHRLLGTGLVAVLVVSFCVGASTSAARDEPGANAAASIALAGRIDQHIAARWPASRVVPAPPASDAEFIRRVYLDLTGRIPSIIEVRDFLDDDRADKRRLWVDRLLESDYYADHFANVWRAALLSRANGERFGGFVPAFEAWLQQQLKENAPYDQVVRDIITGSPSGPNNAAFSAFYQDNEQKPENLAASTSRLFLGVKLECAQCHAHPFARWTRSQFWELAAFFADLGPQGGGSGRHEIQIPGTDKVVKARFLDGAEPVWLPGRTPRATLAEWVTAADNPYFARNAVNRLWAYFFGRGLVDPVDEPGDENPPSHPELLDELAREFAGHRFDIKFLIRTIVASQAYQRTSTATHPSQHDPRLFARMALRGLTPEQLFDSLAEATEYRGPDASPPVGRIRFNDGSPRAQFLRKFPDQDVRTERSTSILQALFLMNGQFMSDATSIERSRVLATVAETASIDTARRIETLYLVALTRKPRPEELSRLVAYVERGGAAGDRRKALADVFWALLNSAEFSLNH